MLGRRLRRREGSKTIAGDQSCRGARREGGAGHGDSASGGVGLAGGCRGMMYMRALCRPLDNTPPPGPGVARTRVCVSACTSVYVLVCRTRTFMYASCSGIFIDHGPPDPPRT